jgi:hypothetical protein
MGFLISSINELTEVYGLPYTLPFFVLDALNKKPLTIIFEKRRWREKRYTYRFRL